MHETLAVQIFLYRQKTGIETALLMAVCIAKCPSCVFLEGHFYKAGCRLCIVPFQCEG